VTLLALLGEIIGIGVRVGWMVGEIVNVGVIVNVGRIVETMVGDGAAGIVEQEIRKGIIRTDAGNKIYIFLFIYFLPSEIAFIYFLLNILYRILVHLLLNHSIDE
jgi:hypothetical protein